MKLLLWTYGLVALFASQAAATALTFKLPASDESCFYTTGRTQNEKIAFYFAVQSGGNFDVDYEARVTLPSKKGTSPEQTSTLEESAFKISGQLSSISRHQKYFRTRENRNFATVRSTEKRIINFSLIQCALIVLMGALQVFIVKFFFQGARKGYV
ncbi:hypothetical protein RB593_008885 [Gaeumannomyces tritici]